MNLEISEELLERASRRIEERLKSPTHGLEARMSNYARLTKSGSAESALSSVNRTFSVLEILVSNLSKRRPFDQTFANIFGAYVASEYGLESIGAIKASSAKAVNPFNVHDLDFTSVYPGIREDLLTNLSRSIGRFNGIGLENQLEMFYGWMNEHSLKHAREMNDKYGQALKDLTVSVGEGFEVQGFQKPLVFKPQSPSGSRSWNEFGGYEEVVEYFQDLTFIMEHYDEFVGLGTLKKTELLPKGVLLHGPPGTGKTTLVEIFGSQAGLPYTSMDNTDIGDSFVNASARKLDEKFQEARSYVENGAYRFSILFMDEIDSYLGMRAPNSGEDNKVVTAYNVNTAGKYEHDGVIVCAATNNYAMVDPAVLSRFTRKFYMGPPDIDTRRKMFEVHTRDRESNLTGKDIETILRYNISWDGRVIRDMVVETYRHRAIQHKRGNGSYIPKVGDYIQQLEMMTNGQR